MIRPHRVGVSADVANGPEVERTNAGVQEMKIRSVLTC